MDPEDEAPRAAGWPQPHPSPPLPPPREYGVPGTPSDPRRWLWGLLAAALVGALAVVLVLVPRGDSDPDDGARHAGAEPSAAPTTSANASTSAPPAPAPYRCWDGTDAQALTDCSRPAGVEGLRWVFPAMADEKCGRPGTEGGEGLRLRVLCLHRLEDGTRIGVGYFAWASVEAGVDFYDAQGLERSTVPGPDGRPVHLGFFGVDGDTVKAATLYATEPFSLTITFPAAVTLSEQDQLALAPRPPEQVRGAPAS